MSRLALAALLAIVLAGCGAAAGTPQPGNATAPPEQDVATEIPITPAPTATPRPTPTPTPEPTPAPTPRLTGDAAAFSDYLDRSIKWSESTVESFTKLSGDLELYDFDAIVTDSRALRTASLTYVDWLDAHPPRACYKQVWTISRQAANDTAAAMKELAAFAGDFDLDAADRGLTLMTKSTEEVERATAAVTDVTCTP